MLFMTQSSRIDSEQERIDMLNKMFKLYDKKIPFSINKLRQPKGKMKTSPNYIKSSYDKVGNQTTKPNLSTKEFIDIIDDIKRLNAVKVKATRSKNMQQFMMQAQTATKNAQENNKYTILKNIHGVPYSQIHMNIYNQ